MDIFIAISIIVVKNLNNPNTHLLENGKRKKQTQVNNRIILSGQKKQIIYTYNMPYHS